MQSRVAQTAKAQAGIFGDHLALLGSLWTPQGEAEDFRGPAQANEARIPKRRWHLVTVKIAVRNTSRLQLIPQRLPNVGNGAE